MSTGYDYTADDGWEMEATKGGGGGDFELCPPGNYPAQIVGLIDVGTHEETNDKGETYDSRKLVLAVELTKKSSKGARFVVSKLFTWSMRDNSNWYKLVSALTGKKFAEGEKFDPRQVLGMPAMANITHVTSQKSGKPFHVLDVLAQYPEDLPKPDGASFRSAVAWSARDGSPLPSVGWIPYVYFDMKMRSVETIVQMSKEARGIIKPRPKAAPAPAPSTVAAVVAELASTPIATVETPDSIPF